MKMYVFSRDHQPFGFVLCVSGSKHLLPAWRLPWPGTSTLNPRTLEAALCVCRISVPLTGPAHPEWVGGRKWLFTESFPSVLRCARRFAPRISHHPHKNLWTKLHLSFHPQNPKVQRAPKPKRLFVIYLAHKIWMDYHATINHLLATLRTPSLLPK